MCMYGEKVMMRRYRDVGRGILGWRIGTYEGDVGI